MTATRVDSQTAGSLRIAVTGSSSFLGSAFCRHATEQGHEVVHINRRALTGVEGDQVVIQDIRAFEASHLPPGTDALVHFATATSGSASEVLEVAEQGTLRVLAACQARAVPRFVFVSSLSVYGTMQPRTERPSIERHPERRGPYAEAKAVAESAVRAREAALAADGVRVAVVRPGLVFGRGMSSPLAGSAVVVPVGRGAVGLGRRNQVVPYVHVDDVANALLALVAGADVDEPIDLVSHTPQKSEVVALVSRLSGQAERTVWIPRTPAVAAAYLADRIRPRWAAYKVQRMWDFDPRTLGTRHAWEVLDVEPGFSVEDGVRDALEALPWARSAIVSGRARAHVQVLSDTVESSRGRSVVLVGAGRIAEEMWLPALNAMPGVTLEAIVDANPVRRNAQPPGPLFAPSLEDLPPEILHKSTVVIATPGTTHCEIAKAAAAGGCAGLIVEKPPAITVREWGELEDVHADVPVSVVLNYRLRQNTRRLWEFLSTHDVGGLRHADVTFCTGPFREEPAGWMRDERANRGLLLELALHFIDLPLALAGSPVGDPSFTCERDREGHTAAIHALLRAEDGASIIVNATARRHSRRAQVLLEFERCTCVLDFFPEGFRVLPPRANPIDDILAGARRFTELVRQRAGRSMPRWEPHARILGSHFCALDGGSSPFALSELSTLRPILDLADAVYGEAAPLAWT